MGCTDIVRPSASRCLRRLSLLGEREVLLRQWVRRIGSLFSTFALIAATSAFAQTPPQGATTLLISGNVESKVTLGISDLRRLAVQRVEDVRQVKMAGAAGKDGEQTRRYTGVLLRDVLTSARPVEARPVEKERHDLRRSIVVASATDGYQAVFSWAEL